jgi:hypothetical protein
MTDQTGKLFVVNKHRVQTRKDRKVLRRIRRRFYEPQDLEEAMAMARKHAAERHEDFLVVQVIAEASKPNAAASEGELK